MYVRSWCNALASSSSRWKTSAFNNHDLKLVSKARGVAAPNDVTGVLSQLTVPTNVTWLEVPMGLGDVWQERERGKGRNRER